MTWTSLWLSSALMLGSPGDRYFRSSLEGTKPITAARVNPDAIHGYLNQPAYSNDKQRRGPLTPYHPEPGDLLLLSDPTPTYTFLYTIAMTGRPGHGGLVVALPDGQLGIFEAGWNDTTWMRVTPLEWRLNQYPGTVWVRKRICPLTPLESQRLTEFTQQAANHKYNVPKFMLQITPFRCRGPLRTFFLGKPHGPGKRYFCAQALLEALLHANLLDRKHSRPAATYPRDLFFDDSTNLYIKLHPPVQKDWQPPALWSRQLDPCGPIVVMPYSDFLRPGAYQPPADLIQTTPSVPNTR